MLVISSDITRTLSVSIPNANENANEINWMTNL